MSIETTYLSTLNTQAFIETAKTSAHTLMQETALLASHVAKHVLAAGIANLFLSTPIAISTAALSGVTVYLANKVVNVVCKQAIERTEIRKPAIELFKALSSLNLDQSKLDFIKRLTSNEFPNLTSPERTFINDILLIFTQNQDIKPKETLLKNLESTRPEFKETAELFLDSTLFTKTHKKKQLNLDLERIQIKRPVIELLAALTSTNPSQSKLAFIERLKSNEFPNLTVSEKNFISRVLIDFSSSAHEPDKQALFELLELTRPAFKEEAMELILNSKLFDFALEKKTNKQDTLTATQTAERNKITRPVIELFKALLSEAPLALISYSIIERPANSPDITLQEKAFISDVLKDFKKTSKPSKNALMNKLYQTRPEFKEAAEIFLHSNLFDLAWENQQIKKNIGSINQNHPDTNLFERLSYIPNSSWMDELLTTGTKMAAIFASLQFFSVNSEIPQMSTFGCLRLESFGSICLDSISFIGTKLHKAAI